MHRRPFFLWILILAVIVLTITSILFMQRNRQLIEKNNRLVLQNDSILSVNLYLEKAINEMSDKPDSIQE